MKEEMRTRWQLLGTIVRICVGLLFIYMGLSKALDPVGFLKLIREYHLPFHYGLVNSIAAILPWFEVFCGLLLALGVAVRGTALAVLLMLLPFTIVVILRAMGIAEANHVSFCAVKFDCGCGAGVVYICWKIVENFGLMLASLFLLGGFGDFWATRYGLARDVTTGRDRV